MTEMILPDGLKEVEVPGNKKDLERLCKQLAGRHVIALVQYGGKRHIEVGIAEPHYLNIGVRVGEFFVTFDKTSPTNATVHADTHTKKYPQELKGPAILYQ